MGVDEINNEEAWYEDNNVITQRRYEEFCGCEGIQVWTSKGWKNILRIVRLKTEKDVYRNRMKQGTVDITEDHSFLDKNREIIKPIDLVLGEEILPNYLDFGESKKTFDKITDKIYNIEIKTLKEKEMFDKGFFLGDGFSGNYRYKSGVKYCWHLNNLDFGFKEKLQRF